MRTVIFLLLGLLFYSSISFAHPGAPAHFSTSNIQPWGYLNDKNQPDGLLTKLAEALEKETNIHIDNQIRPYPRVIHEVKMGTTDFAVMFNSPQSRAIGISVGHVVNPKIVLTALVDSEKITDLAQLKGKAVGYLRGSKYGAVFDNNELNKVPLGSMEQGIKMLLTHRIYAMVGTEHSFYFTLKKLKISTDKVRAIFTVNETSGDLYFAKKSKNKHLIEPFKKALRTLKEKGILYDIFYNNDYMPLSSHPKNKN